MFCSTTVVDSTSHSHSLGKFTLIFNSIYESNRGLHYLKKNGKKSFEFFKVIFDLFWKFWSTRLNTISGCFILFLQNKTLQQNWLFNFPPRHPSCFCHRNLVGKSEAVPLLVIHSLSNSSSGFQSFLHLFYFQNL